MAFVNTRERSLNSDQNQAMLDKIALSVFADMGIISQDQYEAVRDNVSKQIDLLQSIKDLEGKQATEFSERFVDKILDTEESYFSLVPPSTLAKCYSGTKERLQDNKLDDDTRNKLQNNLNTITHRIDELISDFAGHVGWHFADPTNIADVYAGYNEMFDAREKDLNDEENSVLIQQINANRSTLDEYMAKYDGIYGLKGITENSDTASSLEKKWDKGWKEAQKLKTKDSTLYLAAKYRFLDENGEVIPQFINDAGEKVVDFTESSKLDKDGRLANVIELARQDMVQKHFLDDEGDYDENEFNDEILYKLFAIDTAEQIVKGVSEDPQRFIYPKRFNEFVNNLYVNGGEISDRGYEAAMDAQVNKTAGWAGRIKQKLGKHANKATGFFEKVFDPIKKIDKRAKDRIKGRSKTDQRQRRIEFFVRMLKGFGSAFLISAALTTIATAAAAVSGLSLAVSMAAISTITIIGFSWLQFTKWRKAQQAAGKPSDLKALLADKRMLATFGTSAIAIIAMAFGAAGLSAAATTLGYGALALGGGNNAISTFKDAKSAGLSTGASIAWAIANAAAVIAGGFAGRATANSLINSYNGSHPDNRIFQQEETEQKWQKIGEHEESETVYRQDTLDNAERIAKMWYRNNPDLLQQRVDMVNAYNAEHGTNIDPYRAIMINADAGGLTADNMGLHVDGGGVVHSNGHHTVMTRAWADTHNFSMDEVNAMRHMFDGGQISDAAMNAAARADNIISSINEIGNVAGAPVQVDNVLQPQNVDLNNTNLTPQHPGAGNGQTGYSTYVDGESPYTTITHTVDDYGYVDVTKLTPVDNVNAMGMFGTYNERHESELKDRPGALADRIENDYNHVEPDPIIIPDDPIIKKTYVSPITDVTEKKKEYIEPITNVTEKQIVLPPHKDPLILPEHKTPLALPPHIEEEQPVIEPKWLRITKEQAKALDDFEKDVKRKERQLSNQHLSKREREKLNSELEHWREQLNKLKNELGNPTNHELWAAQYWAWRKYDLIQAEAALEEVKRRKITGNSTKYDVAEKEREIARLEGKIAEYKAEIPDESLFFDPVAVQYDKQTGKKVPKFQKGIMNVQKKMYSEEVNGILIESNTPFEIKQH